MGIPRVTVTTKQVLSQGLSGITSPGYEAAIVGHFKCGSYSPTFQTTVAGFLREYTPSGAVPTQASFASTYLSAINFLKTSGSGIWVQRAKAPGATWANGNFLAYVSPIDLEVTEVVDYNVITSTDLLAYNGNEVTIYGSIPDSVLGNKYYLKCELSGEYEDMYEVSFWSDAEMTEDQLLVSIDTYTVIYILTSEYFETGGLLDVNTVSAPDSGFVIAAKSAGAYGNDICISIEVPREIEHDINMTQKVRVGYGQIPVGGADWSTPADFTIPVRFFPTEDSVLPDGLDSTTTFFITAIGTVKDSGLTTVTDGISPVLEDSGSGSLVFSVIGTEFESNTGTDGETVVCTASVNSLFEGGACFVYPTVNCELPSPLQSGVLYYIVSVSGTDISLSAESATGDLISISGYDNDTTKFKIACLLNVEEDIGVDVDNTIPVTQIFPTGSKVRISGIDDIKETDEFYVDYSGGNITLYTDVTLAPETLVEFAQPQTVTVTPVSSTWTDLYETSSLDGAVDYVDNTISLGAAAQDWVPGEMVRFYPDIRIDSETGDVINDGSELPRGITSYSTYVAIPIDDAGTIKIGRLVGTSVLTSMADVSIVSLYPAFQGTGMMAMASSNSALYEDTFRVKVYKKLVASDDTISYDYLEEYVCSLYTDRTDSNGRSYYLNDRLASSSYVIGFADDVSDIPPGTLSTKAVPVLFELGGGDDTSALEKDLNQGLDSTSFATALEDLSDPLQFPYDYLLDGGIAGQGFAQYQADLASLAETRRCFAVLSTPEYCELETNPHLRIIAEVNNLPVTAYAGVFGPWQVMSEAVVSGTQVMAPPDGYVAGRMAQVDRNQGIGTPAAGIINGGVNSGGSRITFSEDQLNQLYDARVNPLIRVQGVGGTVIWGNQTLLNAPTPTSEIHVIKLDNKITKDLSNLLLRYVNVRIDTNTYAAITQTCRTYLDTYVSKGTLTSISGDEGPYVVICDDRNNTEADRDAQIINVDVAYKPVRSSKYVHLVSAVTPGGVSFESVFYS